MKIRKKNHSISKIYEHYSIAFKNKFYTYQKNLCLRIFINIMGHKNPV